MRSISLYASPVSLSPCRCLLCFRLQSACFLIGYLAVPCDNPQSVCSFVLSFPRHNRISDHKYLTYLIFTISNRGSQKHLPSRSGRVKSLLIHLTPQKKIWQDNLQNRQIIKPLLTLVGRGESGPKSAPMILQCVYLVVGSIHL